MHYSGDYHIHTPFCLHGSNDPFESYVIQAIKMGLKEISFTEHAPLPKDFVDPVPNQDSAMNWSDLSTYFNEGNRLKNKYNDRIKINVGFELDYIEGFDRDIRNFLNEYGKQIDDAILSVHMLKTPDGGYHCLDYSADAFADLITLFGSIDNLYQKYYQTLLLAVQADLGPFKPTRIGHLTLIEKFSLKYPNPMNQLNRIKSILQEIKSRGYSLDLNTAGLYKPDCQSIYPNLEIVKLAQKLKIPLVPGSDSHQASTLAQGFDKIKSYL
ncbi:histidinol-phosphatase HisJ [Amphibacillus sediminis]|uniref:histidinol-phosphatase HisJ n=1 Tax=Amphibacillus sediminis TaxID=360185 RepID=UPI00082EB361|nr:histidinol-phosphatase HisJ [Amphibacillus sediminis]